MNTPDKILLIEDNVADVALVRLAFEEQNISSNIVHCADGQYALNTLTEQSANHFKYILLDLNMPRLNGLEFLKICKEKTQYRSLPIIVFTTSISAHDIQKCYELGANAYVQKPIELSEFDRIISAINGFWGMVNVRA